MHTINRRLLYLFVAVEAGKSVSVCLKAIGSIVSFQVLLCLSVIVYVSLNCVLMYIGNDIRDMWIIRFHQGPLRFKCSLSLFTKGLSNLGCLKWRHYQFCIAKVYCSQTN